MSTKKATPSKKPTAKTTAKRKRALVPAAAKKTKALQKKKKAAPPKKRARTSTPRDRTLKFSEFLEQLGGQRVTPPWAEDDPKQLLKEALGGIVDIQGDVQAGSKGFSVWTLPPATRDWALRVEQKGSEWNLTATTDPPQARPSGPLLRLGIGLIYNKVPLAGFCKSISTGNLANKQKKKRAKATATKKKPRPKKKPVIQEPKE